MHPHAHRQATRRSATRGFALILCASDYADLISRHRGLYLTGYDGYLAAIHRRMHLALLAGHRVLIGPLLIDQHVSFAERIGAPPFSTPALRAFGDFVVQTCPYVHEWRGDSMSHVISELRAAVESGRGPPFSNPRKQDDGALTSRLFVARTTRSIATTGPPCPALHG